MIPTYRLAATIFVLVSSIASAQPRWELVSEGMSGADVRSLAIDNSSAPFAATGVGIYRFDPSARQWRILSTRTLSTLLSLPDGTLLGVSDLMIVRSSDGGRSWSATESARDDITRIAYAPSGSIFAGSSYSLYRSDDGGRRWKSLPVRPPSSGGAYVGFCIAADGTVLTIDPKMVRRSTDNGDSWQSVDSTHAFREMVATADGTLLAAGPDRLYRSTDNGSLWRAGGAADLSLVTPGSGGTIHAVRQLKSYSELERSTDNGVTWSRASYRVPELMAVAPDGDLWIVENDSILVSTDNGSTWRAETRMEAGYPSIGTIAEAPDGSLLAATGGTIFRSRDNGESWLPVEPGLQGDLVGVDSSGGIYASSRESIWMASGEDRIDTHLQQSRADSTAWRFVPGQRSFKAIDLSLPTLLAASFSENGTWGSVFAGNLSVSVDGGRNWRLTTFQRGSNIVAVTRTGAILTGVYEGGCMFSDAGIFMSRDTGATWSQALDSVQANFLHVADNGTIYLAGIDYSFNSSDPNTFGHPLFIRSTDDGRSWESILDSGYVGGLHITRSGDLYVRVNYSSNRIDVLFSDDNGGRWRSITPTPGRWSAIILASLPNGDIIARGDTLLYRSSDHGTTWRSIQFDLPPGYATTVIGSRGGYLFAATGSGLYRMPIAAAGVDASEIARSTGLSIGGATPNPLTGSSTFPIELASPLSLRVTLCDLLGRELRLIHEGLLPGGTSTLMLERGDLPAGTYLLLACSAQGVESRLIVVE